MDYFEQEINGIAKNFEAVETSEEKQPEKEKKKGRTKKFKIQDSVNVEKVTFEEKPIQVLERVDINKTLATPSRINRLQKMKEFFSKNKSRTGKLVIPKSLLFTNDNVLSNFGSTQIYDYDDHKDIVGSRRDFTSFSYFINNYTGELQSDIRLSVNKSQVEEDNNLNNLPCLPPDRIMSPIDWTTLEPLSAEESVKDCPPLNINIDEGIEMQPSDMLLPSPGNLIGYNDSLEMKTFENSALTEQHDLSQKITDYDLPAKTKNEVEAKMKNIFMIPLKKLKHRCIFDLPNDEFGELKKRKRDQGKSTLQDLKTGPQARLFKLMEKTNNDPEYDEPFLGFTKEQQKEPMTWMSYKPSNKEMTTLNSLRDRMMSSETDIGRKYSNDSGLEMDSSDNEVTDKKLSENESATDSCYLSLVSGDSTKTDLSTFFKGIESRNNTIDESTEQDESGLQHVEDDTLEESEERVAQMQQSAINVSRI